MTNFFKKLNLKLFGEGGEGAATTASTGESAAPEGETQAIKYVSQRKTKQGETKSDVVYGKQTAPTGQVASDQERSAVKVTSSALEDKKAAFDNLINGEYKDLYTENVQNIINRRFKETKNLESKVSSLQPLVDLLSEKYSITDGNVEALMKAFEDDNDFWYSQAEEAGMTVEQYKNFKKLERENKKLLEVQEQEKQDSFAKQQTENWLREAEQVKSKYPNFDLAQEVQNQQFLNMLKAGTPVEHAYKVMHFDEIMSAERNVTEQAVIQNIRAKGTRPTENGISSQSAFTIKDDVSKLTKADRAAIAKRVARGEIIEF